MKDTDFLFMTAMLRAREASMLKGEKIDRMLEAPGFDDAAKLLLDCGYPDMSGMGMEQIEDTLQTHRGEIFNEISGYSYARDLLDLFRIKYDYNNVKVLVKSAGASIDALYLLSGSGRVDAKALNDAFVTGQRGDIPAPVAAAIDAATGILSRTGNPQLADIEIDKIYFGELSALAKKLNNDFITGYVRLLIDSANLRTFVRSARTKRDDNFLLSALIPGGSIGVEQIASSYGDNSLSLFSSDALKQAVYLGSEIMGDGAQTQFERACDDAVLTYVTDTSYVSFGAVPVIAYLTKLEWELTVIRMILTGKLTGISKDIIRERLRECHV